jgi:2-polyprenyl-6-methoxyphenol hydroxylase-like FAD-dependent oxidoreductase
MSMSDKTGPVPVLIVGGGPVGLAAAIELGWRGVPCLLVEQGDGRVVEAKMFATGIRTLEFCRRWGIAKRVRDWGFPRDFPFDNVFVTTLAGYELARIAMPSLARTPPIAQSPENFAHCPQFVFDPILAERACGFPGVTLRYRTRLASFSEDADGVHCALEHDGRVEAVRAKYVVACDGYSSGVRKSLGIEMQGDEFLNRSVNIMFRTKHLASLHGKGDAGRYVVIGSEGPWASLTAADGAERWRLMVYQHDTLSSMSDPADAVRRAVGRDFEFEILTVGIWVRRNLLAERYGSRRVLLAGDAVHVMPPNGGLGMNTGIGDAVDLGWKLAAVHEGWGGAHLLASYEAERRPAGRRACEAAMKNFERITPRRSFPAIHEDSPEGRKTRAQLGAKLSVSMRNAWDNPLNTHLGYRYDGSPICVADGTPPPEPADSREYRQSSHPGGRAPHAWLADGRSTLDLFGRAFTLLQLGADGAAFVAEAKRRSMPLEVARIDDAAIAALYEKKLVLVRPDGHVAWRGDAPPRDPGALLDRVRGAVQTTILEEETS